MTVCFSVGRRLFGFDELQEPVGIVRSVAATSHNFELGDHLNWIEGQEPLSRKSSPESAQLEKYRVTRARKRPYCSSGDGWKRECALSCS